MQLKVCELFISWIFHLTFSNWGCLWVTETSYSGTVDGGQGETIVVKGCFCSVTNWCSTLRDPIDCNMPGSLVLHYFPEFAQTQGHWFSNAIQPSHPLFLPFPLALNVSQHQSFPMSHLFATGGQSIGASALPSVLPMNIQGWFLLELTGLISL